MLKIRPVVPALALGGLVLSAMGLDAQQVDVQRLANAGKPSARFATSALVGQNVHGRVAGPGDEDDWERLLPNISAPKGRRRAVGFAFAGANASYFPNLEDVGCDQLAVTTCTADDLAVGPAFGLLARPFASWPIGFGARGGYSRVSVTQNYVSSPFPITSVTDLDVWTATAFADAWLWLDDATRLVATAGYVWSWNRGTVTSTFEDRVDIVHRNEQGGRYTVGGSLERDILSNSWLRFEYRFIDGEAGDADRQHQVGLLFGLGVFGGHVAERNAGVRVFDPLAPPADPWAPRVPPVPPGIVVPPLIGLTSTEARIRLDSLGLDPRFSSRPSPQPPDVVIAQAPAIPVPPLSSARATRGVDEDEASIRPIVPLVVAAGIPVPRLNGIQYEDALQRIEDSGLTPGSLNWIPSDLPPLTVVRQSPDSGQDVPLNAPIDLDVSGIPVPNVTGDPFDPTREGGLSQLPAVGLTLGVVDSALSAQPVGTISSQEPDPGEIVGPGTPVHVTVAQGVAIPNVVGDSTTLATGRVGGAGLRVGTVTGEASSLEPGTVLGQTPASGTVVPLETTVDLRVAVEVGEDPVVVAVPDLTGLDSATARLALDSLGLSIGEIELIPSIDPPGTVTGLSPGIGTPIPVGTSIDLTISRPIAVPALGGLDSATARRVAEDALLVPEFELRFSTEPPGTVIGQNPPPGVGVPPGGPLVISIARPLLPFGMRALWGLPLLALIVFLTRAVRQRLRRGESVEETVVPAPAAPTHPLAGFEMRPVADLGEQSMDIDPLSGFEMRRVIDEGRRSVEPHDSILESEVPSGPAEQPRTAESSDEGSGFEIKPVVDEGQQSIERPGQTLEDESEQES